MSDAADPWKPFWNVVARIEARMAQRADEAGPPEEWDREEIDRRLKWCDRAVRELRAALRDFPEPSPLGHELSQMQDAVKFTTLANRALKAEWSALRPNR